MNKNDQKRKIRIKKLKVTAVIVLLLFLLYIFDRGARPVIYRYCEDEMRLLSVETINNAMIKLVNENGVNYENLINITYQPEGTVSAINLNVEKLNTIKEMLLLNVNNDLKKLAENKVRVPIGTLLNIVWLNGKGPGVGVCFAPVSYAEGEIKTGFQSAGYNQSLYTVSICVTVRMQAIIPGYINTGTVNYEVALAQTVIVGEVPQFNCNLGSGV